MKVLITLFILVSSLWAKYSVTYSNLKLGTIYDLNSVKENYFKAKVTNPMARFLLGKKHLIYFNEKYKGKRTNKKIKYKEDKYFIIEILKQSLNNTLKEGKIFITQNKYIEIKKNENYRYRYISKGRVKSYGKMILKGSDLISLVDEKNNIKIVKQ